MGKQVVPAPVKPAVNTLRPIPLPSARLEDFKRLKHRLNLEHVSSLSQQAVAQVVAALVLCDNLQALSTPSALDAADLPESVRINRAYGHIPEAIAACAAARKEGRQVVAQCVAPGG